MRSAWDTLDSMQRGYWILALAVCATACTHGYVKASDLAAHHQGPMDCHQRCNELGMEMGALVLVSDQLPGCVCVPRATMPPASAQGASAATGSYVVIAAAAAAERQRQLAAQQQRQQQQSMHH